MNRMNKLIVTEIVLICYLINVYSQPLKYKGYPSREGKIDIRSNFMSPPKGYGNVPFYWWDGDSLKYERLMDQLSILSEASVDGLSVSYIHTHPAVDTEINSHGYGSFGRADAGIPGFYTDEWWSLWNKFSGECAKRNIGLGVDDYVVGWAKNGFYVDEVLQSPEFCNYQGRLSCKSHKVNVGEKLDVEIPKRTLCVMAFPSKNNLASFVRDGKLEWFCEAQVPQTVYIISTIASPELHPEYGKRLVDVYFNRFEKKLDSQGRKGMNYFFQDELHYELNIHSWCEDMRQEFKKRKGYDIFPYLPALWEYIGDITPKVRLDYAQVVTELAEERYFKPIYNWHDERGLIYGCDNAGRGLEPLQYLDYFRTTSWFTAPGNDAPARGSSFRQTKVSSSITHLYERPRTWLEAFHSMGWDSNGEWLTSQLEHHLIAGGNLLCLHGLYYSTHGGWWEWAPPCFHFRMPYWPHMKRWLKYAERMSFVLSQGTHVCDIAVMYPTEALQAYPDTNMDLLWRVTDHLSSCGLDYDFIDYQSLQQAKVKNGCLNVSDERYKVLILADMKAMHYETLLKVYEFYKKGGIVLAVGNLPQATSRVGENDPKVAKMRKEIFSAKTYLDEEDVANYISSLIVPDFRAGKEAGKVLHRKIGKYDLYMVMNVPKGDEVFFRCKGKVECWDAWNGKIDEIQVLKQTDEGTWVRYDAEYNESKLFVFSPGEPMYEMGEHLEYVLTGEVPLEGEWDVDVVPTMNNKWGDFRLPATDEMIGPEAREFSYKFVPDATDYTSIKDDDMLYSSIYGYAPYMEMLVLPKSLDLSGYLPGNLPENGWTPYCYSWQYGVFDNPGSQGYHGLKGKVDNRFIILDKGKHQIFRTYVYAPYNGSFRIEQEGEKPTFFYLNEGLVHESIVEMKKGWHQVILVYADAPGGSYVLEEKKSYSVDDRKRSAVVFYPAKFSPIKDNYAYDTIVAMKWYKTEHLEYSSQKMQNGIWVYNFQTAPGTRQIEMTVNGKILGFCVNGKFIALERLKKIKRNSYQLDLDENFQQGVSVITVMAEPKIGYIGAAFFIEPVKMVCNGGKMQLGNWTNVGALKFYSGGMNYRKNVYLKKKDNCRKIILSLGNVNATCEVKINGKGMGILMHTPYTLDVSNIVVDGVNCIEILVYSTLSNHYQTIPSAYRGNPISGLLGPVKLLEYD